MDPNLETVADLTKKDFNAFLTKLYQTEDERYNEIFDVFDRNNDGLLDADEMKLWKDKWLSKVLKPVSAFLIVDVQNDFISGTLDIRNCPAGHNGEEIITPINNLLKTVAFDKIFYTLDWHPDNHISFFENKDARKFHVNSPIEQSEAKLFDAVVFEGNPPVKQILWPRHCVQNTWGSELHKDLIKTAGSVEITKGTNPDIDSYSAFWDNEKLSKTELLKCLREAEVTDVYVCGLAYDVCVGSTALDAISSGFRTVLVEDCCRGVDDGGMEKVKNDVISRNGIVVQSADVGRLVGGDVRRLELGYFLAKYLEGSL